MLICFSMANDKCCLIFSLKLTLSWLVIKIACSLSFVIFGRNLIFFLGGNPCKLSFQIVCTNRFPVVISFKKVEHDITEENVLYKILQYLIPLFKKIPSIQNVVTYRYLKNPFCSNGYSQLLKMQVKLIFP